MPAKRQLTALLIGDLCGKPGSRALFLGLPQLLKKYRADIVVVNGENAAEGFGLKAEQVHQLFALGVQVITSGNHIWHQEDIYPLLEREVRLLRPANYPPKAPGKGHVTFEVGAHQVSVINLQGRYQMGPLDCPFRVSSTLVDRLRRQSPIIIVDFHAESNEEKEALGFYLDGKVSVVFGTHTHVQSCDEKILPKGTAYITDVGLTGPLRSVIGSDTDIAIERQLTQMPLRNQIADQVGSIQGIVCTIDAQSGKALSIERFSEQFGF